MKKSSDTSAFISFAVLAVLLPMVLAAPSFRDTCDGDPKLNKKIDYCFHVLNFAYDGACRYDLIRCIRYIELASGIPPAMGDEYVTGEYFWNDDVSYYHDLSKWQEWYRLNKCTLTSDCCDSLVKSELRAAEDRENLRIHPDRYYEYEAEEFANDSIMLNYIAYLKEHNMSDEFAWRWRSVKSEKTDSLSELIYPYIEKSSIYSANFLSSDQFCNIFSNYHYYPDFCSIPNDVYFIHQNDFSAIMLTDDDPYDLSEYCFIYTKTLLKNPSLIPVKKDWYAFKRYNINFHLY